MNDATTLLDLLRRHLEAVATAGEGWEQLMLDMGQPPPGSTGAVMDVAMGNLTATAAELAAVLQSDGSST